MVTATDGGLGFDGADPVPAQLARPIDVRRIKTRAKFARNLGRFFAPVRAAQTELSELAPVVICLGLPDIQARDRGRGNLLARRSDLGQRLQCLDATEAWRMRKRFRTRRSPDIWRGSWLWTRSFRVVRPSDCRIAKLAVRRRLACPPFLAAGIRICPDQRRPWCFSYKALLAHPLSVFQSEVNHSITVYLNFAFPAKFVLAFFHGESH